ncbi:PKD domain-containing protein [Candidatus Parcubacteria bacterium]|nr:PKD domain-containing protein [Candidatus Parcubacteria bacterium]
MNFFRIAIVAAIFLAPSFAYAAVSSFVFTSLNQLELTSRQTVSVQSQNSAGEKENIAQTTCMEVRTTSSSGRFFSGTNSAESVSILILTMSKNSANRNFYYEDSQAGSYTFNLKAAYRPEGENRTCPNWPTEEWANAWNATQQYTVGNVADSSAQSETSSSTASATAPSSGGNSAWPVEPQIYANAGSDRIAIVGADITFEGKALGINKESLEGARYIWNFGDGARKEGKIVAHAYKYPGDYVVVLDVSSGYYSASDRANVRVENSKLVISRAGGGFVELSNGSGAELDLSAWLLHAGDSSFAFPEHTMIGGGKKLVIADETSGLSSNAAVVELLYPNGTLAYRYEKGKSIAANLAPVAAVTTVSASPKAALPLKAQAALAAVAAADTEGDEGDSSPVSYTWLIALVGIAFLGVIGVYASGFGKKETSKLTAEDFTIIEEE